MTSLLSVILSCESLAEKRSQLLVVVNSNFEPERELATVVIRVDGEARPIPIKAEAGPEIPFSFGVLPPAGDTSAKVTVEAQALSPDGAPLACPARAHVGFVVGEARVVQLALTHACGAGGCACTDTETCVQGECISYDLDVSALPSVEPGRELEGIEVSPSTTLPDPERPLCNADEGPWSDIARELTRTYDGQLCPVMSDGTEWGSSAYSLEMNRKALSDYIDRHLEVEHDVITLQVAWQVSELRVLGLPSDNEVVEDLIVPTLRETLQLPMLQAAQQPLQLVVREKNLSRSILVETLPRILLDSGIVQRCRPIYLTATGPASFTALRQLRESIRTQPRWSELWNLVHFNRRITADTADAALGELNEAVEKGFDRVALDSQRIDFPFLRRSARALHVPAHLYGADGTDQVADLCDGSSGIEMLLSTQRPPEIRFFDEVRYQLSSARTLIELDVGELQAGSTVLSYKGFPDLSLTRNVSLDAEQPTLVTGEMGTKWGDDGTVLRFSAESKQHVTLHDATYNIEETDRLRYFAWPIQALMVTARLPVTSLPEGARQVLISKLRGESGWALQYVNEGAGSVLQYLWYGRGREDQIVTALKGSIPVTALPMQIDALFTIYLKNHRIAIWSKQETVLAYPTMDSYNQHIMVTNDAPITLGADPDGGGYFEGDIQSVKISAMYEGGRGSSR
jgi:hypothetical protein